MYPRNYKFFSYLVIILFLAGANPLLADSLDDHVQALEGYDIYEALVKSDWPVPSPRMSNKDLYKISEYVVGQGYPYFSVSPELPKGGLDLRPDMWQFFLEGKEVVIIANDVIPKKSKWYVWDAKRIYRKARNRLGYRDERKNALIEINQEVKRNPEDINALSRKAAVLSEKVKYEGEELTDYFYALKQLIQAKLKRGDLLDPGTDLGEFMDVAICSDHESEYLDVLNLMPPGQAETRKSEEKKYNNKRLEFCDPDEKKILCRVYGAFTNSKKTE